MNENGFGYFILRDPGICAIPEGRRAAATSQRRRDPACALRCSLRDAPRRTATALNSPEDTRLQSEGEARDSENARLKEDLAVVSAAKDSLQSEIAKAKLDLAAKDSEIAGLTSRLGDAVADVSALKPELAHLETTSTMPALQPGVVPLQGQRTESHEAGLRGDRRLREPPGVHQRNRRGGDHTDLPRGAGGEGRGGECVGLTGRGLERAEQDR